MASKWTRYTRRGTVHSMEIWEGDRRRTSVVLGEPGQTDVSPDLVLWADRDHNVIVGQEVLMPDAPPQAVAESLRRAINEPTPGGGPPRQPRRIRVSRADLAEAVRPVTESLGIDLEVADSLPLIDGMFRTFEVRFGSPTNQGYLSATEIPEPLVAELFEAAAEFYRAKLWKDVRDSEPILLTSSAWQPPHRYAVVMGSGRGVKGLALYDSWKDLIRLASTCPDDPEADQLAARIPAVALVFTTLRSLGTRRVEEAKSHGWALVSRNAYPVVVGTGRGRESLWPTPGEARTLIAALRALSPFQRDLRNARAASEEGVPSLSGIYRVPAAGEEVGVRITNPAPARPER